MASWRALAAPAASDSWVRIWPRNSSARASLPGLARSNSASLSASASRSSRKRVCSSRDPRLEVVRVKLKGLPPLLDREINFLGADQRLTDQHIVVGGHGFWSQPLENRRRGLIYPLTIECSTQQAKRALIVTVLSELLSGFSRRRGPVLMVICGLALFNGAGLAIPRAPPNSERGRPRQNQGADECRREPTVSQAYALHGHLRRVSTVSGKGGRSPT